MKQLIQLKEVIENLEGIEIPYNIIKHNIIPLKEWLDEELKIQSKEET